MRTEVLHSFTDLSVSICAPAGRARVRVPEGYIRKGPGKHLMVDAHLLIIRLKFHLMT